MKNVKVTRSIDPGVGSFEEKILRTQYSSALDIEKGVL